MDFAVVVGLHGRRLREPFAFLNLRKSAKQVKYVYELKVRVEIGRWTTGFRKSGLYPPIT